MKRIALLCFFVLILSPLFDGAVALERADEEKLGREIVQKVEERYGFFTDPDVVMYVRRVGDRIVSAIDDPSYRYQFYVVNQEVPNAFTIPGGHVFINKGLIKILDGEGELASILAHEIAHAQARHIHRQLELQKAVAVTTLAAGIVSALLGSDPSLSQAVAIGGAAGSETLALAYSRDHEREADQIGTRYLIKAGYGPEDAVRALKRLADRTWGGNPGVPDYLKTHPGVFERIDRLSLMTADYGPGTQSPEKGDTEFYFVKALVYARSGDLTGLESLINRWEKQGIDNCIIEFARALYFNGRSDYSAAVEKATRARDLCGLNSYTAAVLADSYFKMGKSSEAEKVLMRAVLADGADPGLHYRLAIVSQERGDYSEALKHLKAISPEDRLFFRDYDYRLGTVLGVLGRLGEAHEALGDYYKREGDFRLAKFHYRKAVEHTADPVKKKEIMKKMGSGRVEDPSRP
ncbi:M48 family metallopeptidase [Thermodesulforhabdus norvegica]|uniref:Putative Zn-dependent protease, contains TPR repeats n=1 Tax=Thermodesulforhabdus norvegica TaxID=39841 RepID=A0A1I4VS20_9BACT|nr:M48 family metallopeptidase [Thermodesulforhabdus norvegica]SFN03746.1 Putative Zn-dependent protease, contains TPR repeats [Thermodesulforhabdus norvegica]